LRLSELIDGGTVAPSDDRVIAGLSADSREVRPGYLFAALAGAKTDGARHVAEAVKNGAQAILAAPGVAVPAGVALIADPVPRRRLALLAARFYGAQPATVAAVTGTNGKTSVAAFVTQLWGALGLPAASLGTLGVRGDDFAWPLQHTTPDPVTLHRLLADVQRRGIEHLALEASSHGLDQYRLDGVRLAAGAFTNLTRDHMDYHPTVESYFAAKMRLFDALLPPGAGAVLNADSEHYAAAAAIARNRGLRVFSYGRAGRELKIRRQTPQVGGIALEAELFGRGVTLDLRLSGDFQVGNALCALGLVVACGADPAVAIAGLAKLGNPPGRLQRVGETNGAAVYVDYAHTPDALKTVLLALRPHAKRRLVAVFGCGGDRDRGKRPLMGAIAAELADKVYVTDDNPRGEAPPAIRAEILAACPGAVEIADRAEAIRRAVADLGPGDVLVIAGKGHEQGQIVGATVLPFDDAVVARDALALVRQSAQGVG
jgi:UDP-N-acetylmuramoyl-L-alanyl-D-glutamate--2,6-diaminopimelate ligase